MKYIDAEKLKAEIDKLIDDAPSYDDSRTYLGEVCSIIDSLQQEQLEGIEGVVHHYANVHYIITNKEQLNARLKDFEEGAEVRVFINARKEDTK